MPTAWSPSPSSADSDSDWIGAAQSTVEGGGGVEQAGQGAGDQLAEGVAQQPGVVEEVPPDRVAALVDQLVGGLVRGRATAAAGWSRSAGWRRSRVAGEGAQRRAGDGFLGGPERDRSAGDGLAADQAADQGEPAAEEDGRRAFGLDRVTAWSQPWPWGPKAERVDPCRAGRARSRNGCTPRARHSGSYSSLGSPRTRAR